MEHRPVFDFHARLSPGPGALTRLLSAMDGSGVARAGVAAGGVIGLDVLSRQLVEGGYVTEDADNQGVLDAARSADGRLTPFWFGNPHQDTAGYREAGAHYAALELSPAVHGLRLDDPRYADYVDLAAEFRHPVYAVCIDREGARVADLADQAGKHPDTVFVLGHLGVGLIDTYGIDLVAPLPNVVVETSGAFGYTVRRAIDLLGADRVLFSAEHPLQHPAAELAKYQALNLPPDLLDQVLWRNAHRILRLEAP